MRRLAFVAALALAASIAACGERNRTTEPSAANPPSVPPATPSAPTMSSSSSSAASSDTPQTHAGTPNPPVPAGSAPTAQDTPVQTPQQDLDSAQEAHSMPRAGQVNNYNSPAYEPREGAGGNSGAASGGPVTGQ